MQQQALFRTIGTPVCALKTLDNALVDGALVATGVQRTICMLWVVRRNISHRDMWVEVQVWATKPLHSV